MALFALTACNDGLDDLTGQYALNTYTMTQVKDQTTTKLGKGVKKIMVDLTNGNETLSLAFGSKEWTLPAASYSYAPSTDTDWSSAVGDGNFAAYLTDAGGNVKLNESNTSITVSQSSDGSYDLTLISPIEGRNNVKVTYSGPISFTIGEDDPEASGYTIAVKENSVTDANGTVYDGLTKYAIVVSDPSGTEVAEFDAVNKSGLSLDDLAGTYTVQGYPTESGLMDNGWVVYMPEYNFEMAGGTYFTDASGVKQYVTNGQINIKKQEGIDGSTLYSFSANDLATLTAKNVAGTGGSFSILFASYTQVSGTVLRDLSFTSSVLGQDMKYSVYLPASWDGTKTFPVLYLLHGADGSNNDWLNGGKIAEQVSAAVAAGTAPEMIVIMPNGTVDGKNLFYVDGYQGDAQYMTFFFNEFQPAVEAMYKAKGDRQNRMIGGLSMGGYGSLYYGALHPEMFSYVYACSPATYVDGTPNLYDLYATALYSGQTLPGITMEIGTSDFLYEYAGYFKAYLDQMGITNDYITREGSHDWTFWTACTPKIVTKAGEVFGK